jgi:hypothetical protein
MTHRDHLIEALRDLGGWLVAWARDVARRGVDWLVVTAVKGFRK